MQSILRSLGHALEGLWHAFTTERNLIRFACVYPFVLILAAVWGIAAWRWIALIAAGGMFMCVELINTSLERFVDAFDEYRRREFGSSHHHLGLKATKDVASAASLVSLSCVAIVIVIVFWPYMVGFLTQ